MENVDRARAQAWERAKEPRPRMCWDGTCPSKATRVVSVAGWPAHACDADHDGLDVGKPTDPRDK